MKARRKKNPEGGPTSPQIVPRARSVLLHVFPHITAAPRVASLFLFLLKAVNSSEPP